MHLLEVDEENPIISHPGRYLAEDLNAGEMLAQGWCRVLGYGDAALAASKNTIREFDPSEDWNDREILFVRPGGFGDLLFLTPIFREMRRRWPRVRICVSCFDRYKVALEHNDDIAEFVPYPVYITTWKQFDAHIWLENILERNEDAREMHAIDVIAKRVKLEFADKTMRYEIEKSEKTRAEFEFPRDPAQKRVGVQMTASGTCRRYPHSADLVRALFLEGLEVFLFGRPHEVRTDEPKGIVNIMMKGKEFRESCAILSTCDVVVAPDSALVHVAGALQIPAVGLYGPFPWAFRTAYAEKTYSLQGMCPVAPCFHHSGGGRPKFPTVGPCNDTGKCEAMAAIPIDRIVRQVQKVLNGER